MKILAFMLIALVASMAVGLPASYADSKLDSLVNIAMKARAQVKFELDRSQNASEEIRALFERGSQQTDLLAAAVEQNEVADAKRYFVAAMKIFKEVTVKLSEPQQEVTLQATDTPQVSTSQINYKNDIDRTEKYVSMLKDLAEKNSFTVDFSRVDGLIQDARSSLEQNDIPALERVYSQLRAALNDIQNAIQQQTEQRQNDRARSFANGYIAKINAMLEKADELGLSNEEIARLVKAKEELASISDPNLLVIKIQQYSITISQTTYDAKQRILYEVSQLEKKLEALEGYSDDSIESKFGEARRILSQLKNETSADSATPLLRQLDSVIKEIENYIRTEQAKEDEPPKQDEPEPQREEQETAQREEPKRASSEVLRLEARLAEIKPYVDRNIESKFEGAQTLLNRLLNQEAASVSEYKRTIRILDFLIDSMEDYVESLKEAEEKDNSRENEENTRDNKEERQENRSDENKNRDSDRD